MARQLQYRKGRRKNFKNGVNRQGANCLNNISKSASNNESNYPKYVQLISWIYLLMLRFPAVIGLLAYKVSSIFATPKEHCQKTVKPDDGGRLIALERKLDEFIEKLNNLELKVDSLCNSQQIDRLKSGFSVNETNLMHAMNKPLSSLDGNVLAPAEKKDSNMSQNVPICIPAPPPPPPPPPPLPVLQPAIQNSGNAIKRTTNQLKPLNNAKKLELLAMTPRPLISLEDITKVKLKKTPCVQRKEKSEGVPRISLEALRSVKLRKTSFDKSRTSPLKAKSPKCKLNSRLALRRISVDTSPKTTPTKTNASLNLFSEDLTPIITCALKKRFDALNFSFEEDKENQEPFVS